MDSNMEDCFHSHYPSVHQLLVNTRLMLTEAAGGITEQEAPQNGFLGLFIFCHSNYNSYMLFSRVAEGVLLQRKKLKTTFSSVCS